MGEVYEARDTRLDRTVALKVLPASFAADTKRRQRFEREARAVARLAHPFICTVFDVGREGDQSFLVMEYLEGQTLAERLRRGPLPIHEVLRYGTQIGEALSAAHKQGVVHRDLKPGNVMLTPSGVKVLDFGIAMISTHLDALDSEIGDGGATEAEPLTDESARLGTVQYMSPEQLEGGPVDARTDIFALGLLLYEMAAGSRAFVGETLAEVITAILRREPRPLLVAAPLAPASLARLVGVCLDKDPDRRWQSVFDVTAELRWIAEGELPGATRGRPGAPRGRRPGRGVLIAGGILALSLGALPLAKRSVLPISGGRRVRFTVLPEAGSRLLPDRPALSPDGQVLIFTASGRDGHSWLWRRALDEPEARPLARSNGFAFPFWSPDGRSVAFEAGDKLMKVPAAGGLPQELATTAGFYGGTWNRSGQILFCPGIKSGLFLVASTGGPVVPVTTPDATRLETAHLYPHFLPDGRRFLFLVLSPRKDVRGIYLGALDSSEKTRLTAAFSAPLLIPNGLLMFGRGGFVFEQPLDLTNGQLTGAARPVAEELLASGGGNVGDHAYSYANGVLAWRLGGVRPTRLCWFDRSGRVIGEVGARNDYTDFALSPDGTRIVASVVDDSGLNDLWLIDAERRVFSRLTSDASDNVRPVFHPDGRHIAFASLRRGTYDVYAQDIASVDAAEPLVGTENDEFPQDISRDGRVLIFSTYRAQGGGDLFSIPLSAGGVAVPLLASEAHENGARFSPDARLFASVSWESGQQEVSVRPFPRTAARWMVSNEGGANPVWRQDGREILYLSTDGQLMSVEVRATGGALLAAKPRALFQTSTPGREVGLGEQAVIGVSPDGRRILLKVPVDEARSQGIAVEVNGPAARGGALSGRP